MSPTVELAHDARATVGESALWCERRALLFWVDIDGGLIHRFDPATGPLAPFDVGEKVGCLTLTRGDPLVIGTESGLYELDVESGERTRFADPEADRPDNRFNDASTDRDGRWWAGTMSMARPQPAHGAFYRIETDRTVARVLDGFVTTNGLAFSPDGRTLYFSDSGADVRTVWACDYDRDAGEPSNRRVFFDTRTVAGRPDGATVDTDGCYWMAGVDGSQLVRLTPRGEVDRIVELPVSRPSRPAFGGPDLATLYVTTISAGTSGEAGAGGLYAVSGTGAQGLPTVPFAG